MAESLKKATAGERPAPARRRKQLMVFMGQMEG